VTECGSGAVRLVLAEDLRGEGREVAKPSLCKGVMKRLKVGEPNVAEAYRASSACCSCLMTLCAAAGRDFGRENRQTLSPVCLTPYSIVLGP
jgi:hypothetical protein